MTRLLARSRLKAGLLLHDSVLPEGLPKTKLSVTQHPPHVLVIDLTNDAGCATKKFNECVFAGVAHSPLVIGEEGSEVVNRM